MCGIAGRFHPEFLPPDPGWHTRADRLLQHRGPDGSGWFADGRCELVHRRLALVDLSPTGHQPMGSVDGTVQLVFNGEIYNHRELRHELVREGFQFRGTSDTEVLLNSYLQWGAALVERLKGMFAFAIYDQRKQQLLMARDRFGIKPLYYAQTAQQWIFASEMKAITTAQGFVGTLDRQACYDFLGVGYVPDPLTGFKEIRALAKGTVVEIGAFGSRTTEFYHALPEPDYNLDLASATEQASSALVAAIGSQRAADVPVAALLSGGIDSGLAVAAYARSGGSAATFTVSFPDAGYDESATAALVADQYKTVHTTIAAGDWNLEPDALCDLLEHFDQPFADTSLIPMYCISREIRQHGYICTISGDGGDEAFGGYSRFPRANRFWKLMSLPDPVLGAAAFTGGLLTDWTRDRGRQMAKAMKLAAAGKTDAAVLLSGLSSYIGEDEKQGLIPALQREDLQTSFRHFNGAGPVHGTLESLSSHLTMNLFNLSLPGDMLRKVDMMSMKASIEVRVPMLDEAMVQLGLRLPHRLKTDGTKGKLVLREIAKRWLPSRVARAPKHGFTIPLDRILKGSFDTMVRDLLLSPTARIRAILDPRQIEEWLRLFDLGRSGKAGGSISREGVYQRLFIALSLELWMRRHRLAW